MLTGFLGGLAQGISQGATANQQVANSNLLSQMQQNNTNTQIGMATNNTNMAPQTSPSAGSDLQSSQQQASATPSTGSLVPGANLAAIIQQVAPNANPSIISAIQNNQGFLNDHGINTPARIAAFLGQTAYESDGFQKLVEQNSGAQYNNRPDLGNTEPDDGQTYKGRGIIQLTGKANYANYGQKVGVDLLSNPQLAQDPDVAVKVAAQYWSDHDLNNLADQGNTPGITRRINGGYNGLDGRKQYTNKFSNALSSNSAAGSDDNSTVSDLLNDSNMDL